MTDESMAHRTVRTAAPAIIHIRMIARLIRHAHDRAFHATGLGCCLGPEAMTGFQVGLPRFLDFSSQIESLPYARTFAVRVSNLLHGAQQTAEAFVFENLPIWAGLIGDDLIDGMHAEYFDRRLVVGENSRR